MILAVALYEFYSLLLTAGKGVTSVQAFCTLHPLNTTRFAVAISSTQLVLRRHTNTIIPASTTMHSGRLTERHDRGDIAERHVIVSDEEDGYRIDRYREERKDA